MIWRWEGCAVRFLNIHQRDSVIGGAFKINNNSVNGPRSHRLKCNVKFETGLTVVMKRLVRKIGHTEIVQTGRIVKHNTVGGADGTRDGTARVWITDFITHLIIAICTADVWILNGNVKDAVG